MSSRKYLGIVLGHVILYAGGCAATYDLGEGVTITTGRQLHGADSQRNYYTLNASVKIPQSDEVRILEMRGWNDHHIGQPIRRSRFQIEAQGKVLKAVTLETREVDDFYIEYEHAGWGAAGGELVRVEIPPGVTDLHLHHVWGDWFCLMEVSDIRLVSAAEVALTDKPGSGEEPGQVHSGKIGQRWAVIVGVSEYEFTGEGGLDDLVFAKKDAQDFARSLGQLGWDRDHIKLVVNEQATKRNVNHLLESWLRIAEPEDMIVLFWSSHGWPDPEDPEKAYFACHDSIPSDPSSGYRMDQVRRLLAERHTRNVVLIADTCHAGKVIRGGDPRDVSIGPALESMKKRQEIPEGWVFIASADSDRKAYEDKAWANGALTHVLLEGLRDNRADGYQSVGARDGVVTLGELRAYVSDRMREESLSILGARLDPLFYTTSTSRGIWDISLSVE